MVVMSEDPFLSEDSGLARLFAEPADPAGGEAFVAGVTVRIARRRRLRTAAPFAALAALLLAVWATWPAAQTLATMTAHGVTLLGDSLSGFFTSYVGTATAGALLLPLAVWAWATGRLRAYFR
jgi:hypothetical protein